MSRGLDGDQRIASSSLTPCGIIVICPRARHFIRCLTLVQPRKTPPVMTENLFPQISSTNQTKETYSHWIRVYSDANRHLRPKNS